MNLKDFESKYIENNIDIKTILFLLKKMEYNNKKKYGINGIIKDIEQHILIERGFNPFKKMGE